MPTVELRALGLDFQHKLHVAVTHVTFNPKLCITSSWKAGMNYKTNICNTRHSKASECLPGSENRNREDPTLCAIWHHSEG